MCIYIYIYIYIYNIFPLWPLSLLLFHFPRPFSRYFLFFPPFPFYSIFFLLLSFFFLFGIQDQYATRTRKKKKNKKEKKQEEKKKRMEKKKKQKKEKNPQTKRDFVRVVQYFEYFWSRGLFLLVVEKHSIDWLKPNIYSRISARKGREYSVYYRKSKWID